MKITLLILFALSLPAGYVLGQPIEADSVWIETNTLRICLRNDGSLYSGAPGGAIQFRRETPNGTQWIPVVKEAAFWLGGVDPSGDLRLSIPRQAPVVGGFYSGIAGVTKTGRIWRVTKAGVLEHLRDFNEDGRIDHPDAGIFSWPAFGNRFSQQYNGFTPGGVMLKHAPFFKHRENLNGIYQPDKGDYPNFFQHYDWFPDQLCGVAFESASDTGDLAGLAFPVQGWCFAYTFDCPDNPVLHNSLFLDYLWMYRDTVRTDSSFAGFYIDPDIGNAGDDYHGSHPVQEVYFACNADSLDDGGFEEAAPLLTVQVIRAPRDTFYLEESRLRVMPVSPPGATGNLPYYARFPELRFEFYRYLTSHWKDGQPLTAGGDGYGQDSAVTRAFPGNPFLPGAWTEAGSANPPGDRAAVLSWYHTATLPDLLYRLSLMITVTPPGTKSPAETFESTLASLSKEIEWIPSNMPVLTNCTFRPYAPFPRYVVRAYPNPANDVLHIQIDGRKPRQIRLYDCFQRMIREINLPNDHFWDYPVDLPVRDLPAGMYYLEATSWETIERVVQKVLIQR